MVLAACGFAILLGSTTRGQQVQPSDSLMRPTDIGTRFTPGMAEAIAESYTKDVLVRRYQLPEDQLDVAHEAIAYRLMTMAHTLDTASHQAAIENLLTTMMNLSASRGSGLWEVGPQISKDVTPMIPAVRDLIGGVANDVRPMLPFKQQMKLAGDLLMVNTSLDAFESTMQRWAEGDIQPGESPFRQNRRPVELDAEGRSKALKAAEKSARAVLDKIEVNQWADYVEQAKQFYDMDDAQGSTADSILREYSQRAEAITQTNDWRNRMFQNRVWRSLSWRLPGSGWYSPLRSLLDREYESLIEPIRALGNEMKDRIDGIPTEAQKRTAEESLLADLADFGLTGLESEVSTP
jgi:hypothetical protein